MRGRKAKPTALKIAAGNPGNRPLPTGEPKPKGNLDRPPADLTQDEVGYWRHVIDNAPSNLLKLLDREVLKIWCRASALHQAARMQIDDEGMTVFGAQGVKAHPLLAVLNQQAATMIKAGSELGFSPSSRTRISIDPDSNEASPYDEIGAKRA